MSHVKTRATTQPTNKNKQQEQRLVHFKTMVGIFDKFDNMSLIDISNSLDAALGIKGTLGVRTQGSLKQPTERRGVIAHHSRKRDVIDLDAICSHHQVPLCVYVCLVPVRYYCLDLVGGLCRQNHHAVQARTFGA